MSAHEDAYQDALEDGKRRAGRIQAVYLWLQTQPTGCFLNLEGEVGFGRECVGIEWRDHYIDTPGSGYNEHGPFFGHDSVGGPPEHVAAYHKHDCLAVLGRGTDAIDGLLDWVEKIRAAGGRIAVKDRERVPGTDSAFNWLLHGRQHAVIEFPTED